MADLEISHPTEEQLTAYYFGEPGGEDVGRHLAVCPDCVQQFEALKAPLALMKTLAVPEPEPDFETQLWRKLQAQESALRARPRWWRRFVPNHQWGLAAAAAGLVVAAFFAGRLTHQATPGAAPAEMAQGRAPEVVRQRLLVAALSDHFEQSERMLIEINNEALGDEHERAENMLAANRLYRQCAAQQGNASLLATLDDLERILLDVAHAPPKWAPDQLRNLRARVNGQGLLFKVKVLGSRMRELSAQPPAVQPRAISTTSLKGNSL